MPRTEYDAKLIKRVVAHRQGFGAVGDKITTEHARSLREFLLNYHAALGEIGKMSEHSRIMVELPAAEPDPALREVYERISDNLGRGQHFNVAGFPAWRLESALELDAQAKTRVAEIISHINKPEVRGSLLSEELQKIGLGSLRAALNSKEAKKALKRLGL